ncbi:roadblock/LC7 domain-containing protein [Methanocella sp. MCL-LM]|uniref:roadblock/LC7 domain-containing protein n=1 Tax=Methanocella sp. MCL-LM TaxID=3412035 RepID=UPI003C714833
MKLPTGTRLAESEASVADLLKQYGLNFKGSINVHSASHSLGGDGFILMDNGTVLAAAYTMLRITLYQFSAIDRMMALPGVRSEIVSLTEEEIRKVMTENQHAAIVSADGARDEAESAALAADVPSTPAPQEPVAVSGQAGTGTGGYEQLISAFTAIPGVIGSALVAEGFPVYQQGNDVDFEHVAAATEDMVRAGTRIAGELQLGQTGQIILETPEYKVIIAPINDMFLCVLARTDTNLGLIRLNIRNAQRIQED